jgi:hypothetical protein
MTLLLMTTSPTQISNRRRGKWHIFNGSEESAWASIIIMTINMYVVAEV